VIKNPIRKKALTILRALMDSGMPWLTDNEIADLTGFDSETVRLEMANLPSRGMPLTATIFKKGSRPRYHLHDYGRAVIRGMETR
jgi:hypothetical protein